MIALLRRLLTRRTPAPTPRPVHINDLILAFGGEGL